MAGWRLEPTASCEAGGPEPPGGAGGGQGGIPLLPTTLATRTRKTKQLTQGYLKIHPRSQSHRLGAGLGKQEARSPPGAAFVAVELSAVGQLVHRHNTAGATRGCGQPSQQADK